MQDLSDHHKWLWWHHSLRCPVLSPQSYSFIQYYGFHQVNRYSKASFWLMTFCMILFLCAPLHLNVTHFMGETNSQNVPIRICQLVPIPTRVMQNTASNKNCRLVHRLNNASSSPLRVIIYVMLYTQNAVDTNLLWQCFGFRFHILPAYRASSAHSKQTFRSSCCICEPHRLSTVFTVMLLQG